MISMSPKQGMSQHPYAISPTSPTSTRGFKRSASSDEENENGDDTRPSSARRNTAVKRACNECRQQKVSSLFCSQAHCAQRAFNVPAACARCSLSPAPAGAWSRESATPD